MIITSETFEIAILAAPIAVVVLAGITLLLLLFKCRKSFCIFALLTLALNWWTEQIPVHTLHHVPDEKPTGVLRVFEYNICGKADYANWHGQEFVDYIKRQNADVLFLPENTVGVCFELEDELKAMYPYSVHSFTEFEAHSKDYCDYTLYCRYPLSDYHHYKVDKEKIMREHPYLDSAEMKVQDADIMAFAATAQVDGSPVTFLHVHLRTNNYDSAKALADGRKQKAHNVYDGLLFGYAFRAEEARIIADSIGNCPNPLIVCGDFNDICGSECVRTIQDCRKNNTHKNHRDRLFDAWWRGGQGFGFTFAAQHLRLRLDHILYSKEFELKSISVDKVPYSDHRPLKADFVLRK